MSEAERDKWDERYRSGSYEGRTHPTALLAEWLPRLPVGRALDVACGAGRNALFLAAAGFQVDALDISAVGLERGRCTAQQRALNVHWLCADLDADPGAALPATTYDLIVWVRYINHDLMPYLAARLNARGHLICEQHLATTANVIGPTNPAFRLKPNQLRDFAQGLRILEYREGEITDPDGRLTALAQLVASAAA